MKVCNCCGGNCDSGEVIGGICLDCIEIENQKRARNDSLARMINTDPFQIEFKSKGELCGQRTRKQYGR